MASPSPLRFELRRLEDPLVVELLASYLAEIAEHISGFDASLAAPPEAADFDPPEGLFLVAFDGVEAVACGGVRRLAPEVGEIRRMWVAASARGRGYGRLLLAHLEDAAREAGYGELLLDTHGSLDAALALYRSAGYLAVSRYNENPFAEHFFSKRLR